MTDVNVSYRYADNRGTPAFEALDQHIDANLLAASEPGLGPTRRILLGNSLTLAVFTVVGLSSGKLVKALYDSDPAVNIAPIGVLAHAATSAGSNTTKFGEVFLTGCFNAGADSPLVWDSTFDTLAKKVGSVVGSPNLVFKSRRATGISAV